MKKIVATCLLALFAVQAFCQKNKHLDVIGEMGSFANLNGGDIKKNSGNFLSQKSNMGGYAGLGVDLHGRKIIYLHASTGFRFSPQSINIQDGNYQATQSFTNVEWYLKLMLGLRWKIAEHNNILFGFGLNNFYSLKNKTSGPTIVTTPYVDPATGENLNHLTGIHQMNWGDNREEKIWLPFINCALLEVGYENTSLLPNHRKLSLSLEFSTRLLPDNVNLKGNAGSYDKFDANRNIIASQKFTDKYSTVGLHLAVGIF